MQEWVSEPKLLNMYVWNDSEVAFAEKALGLF